MAEGPESVAGSVGRDRAHALEFHAGTWAEFQRAFTQVQGLLEQNRMLIAKINQNQQSGVPERVSSNVALFQQLSQNLVSAQKLYAAATESFNQCFTDAPATVRVSEKSIMAQATSDADSSVREANLGGFICV